ncbi:hypothetical protein MMC14_008343 [Varicellaria rhodocarpa]|nr:hypothetical protein [Varicellaria rhodocarpa]
MPTFNLARVSAVARKVAATPKTKTTTKPASPSDTKSPTMATDTAKLEAKQARAAKARAAKVKNAKVKAARTEAAKLRLAKARKARATSS